MKGELEMVFVDVIDVKQGLAIYRNQMKSFFKKKIFNLKIIFLLFSEWKRLGINFKHL